MNRRRLFSLTASAAGATLVPRTIYGAQERTLRRVRPSDAAWPSPDAWTRLSQQVGGNLLRLESPFAACVNAPASEACAALFRDVKNPFYVGDDPALTQTLGWLDAWTSSPSPYAVAARDAADVAAAVNFARENRLRLVVKGGAHSYQGQSNATDSLLVWTRHMDDIELHDGFVPRGCASVLAPQAAVTLGAGVIWLHAYDAVTTKGGRYVQGGGCTTVGVVGLVSGGGFGSFSKHYGLAAAALLEAEIVTADGQIRIANARTNADLFWALKGGGGGTFGVVTKLTLRTRDLPDWFGIAALSVKASTDADYLELIERFLAFYAESLFNPHWGEQASFGTDGTLSIFMLSHGLDEAAAKAVWVPFLGWLASSPAKFTLNGPPLITSSPARYWWAADALRKYAPSAVVSDTRSGARPTDFWYSSNTSEAGWWLSGYESLWLGAKLLEAGNRNRLSNAVFAATRHWDFAFHFNKGLAGAPPQEVVAARDTAMNAAVLDAFALVISGQGSPPSYPGVNGHEPDVARGREDARRIHASLDALRAVAESDGSYFNETSYFQNDWQTSFWGSHYARLASVKKTYDPDGLFFVHHGVGSEHWSPDGFTRIGNPD